MKRAFLLFASVFVFIASAIAQPIIPPGVVYPSTGGSGGIDTNYFSTYSLTLTTNESQAAWKTALGISSGTGSGTGTSNTIAMWTGSTNIGDAPITATNFTNIVITGNTTVTGGTLKVGAPPGDWSINTDGNINLAQNGNLSFGNGNAYISEENNYDLSFYGWNGASVPRNAIITGTGLFGIGLTPSEQLSVKSNMVAGGFVNATNGFYIGPNKIADIVTNITEWTTNGQVNAIPVFTGTNTVTSASAAQIRTAAGLGEWTTNSAANVPTAIGVHTNTRVGVWRVLTIPAGALIPGTNGEPYYSATASTNFPQSGYPQDVFEFSATKTNCVTFGLMMPYNWDGNAVKIGMVWSCGGTGTNSAAATNIIVGVNAQGAASGNTPPALGTTVYVTNRVSAGNTSTNNYYLKTPLLTINNGGTALAGGDYAQFTINGYGGHASWTCTNKPSLKCVALYYKEAEAEAAAP